MKKILFSILLLATINTYAYDFSAVCSSGQTLYYTIINANCVQLEAPANNYQGYEKPIGSIHIPKQVFHNGVRYTITSIYNAFPDCHISSVYLPNIDLSECMFSSYSSNRSIIDSLFIHDSTTVIPGASLANTQIDYLYIGNFMTNIGCVFYSNLTYPCGYQSGVQQYCHNTEKDGIPPVTIDFNAKNCTNMTLSWGGSGGTIYVSSLSYPNCFGRLNTLILGDSVESLPPYAFSTFSRQDYSQFPFTANLIYNSNRCHNFQAEKIFVNWIYRYSNSLHPNYVSIIDDTLTSSCRSISIGEYVEQIPEKAFANMRYSCGPIKIPNSVNSIGKMAFYNTGIDTLIIGDSTAVSSPIKLDTMTFMNCHYLKDISIKKLIDTISPYTFASCENLKTVSIFSNSVKLIDLGAFSNCTQLQDFRIPDSVTLIGQCAFFNCSNLYSLVIGQNVTTIGDSAFYGCTGVIYMFYNARNCSTGFSGLLNNERVSFIPNLQQLLIGNNVQIIPEYAFYGCSQLDGTLIIPDSVTIIGQYAFFDCSDLDFLIIGQHTKFIGDYAFNGCFNLNGTLIIPDSVTFIGQHTFQNCSSLDSLVIGQKTNTISDYAFKDCFNLNGILVIPDSVILIGLYAFQNCFSLDSLVIGQKTNTIGDYAFGGCFGLTSLELGNSMTTIGNYAFQGCTGFNSLELGNSPTLIGNNAFEGCTGLTSLELGNKPTTIGDYVFRNCTNLSHLTLNDSVLSIGNHAFENLSITGVLSIPASVENIGHFAFGNCDSISQLIINGAHIVSDSTFYDCDNMISVNFNNTPVSIGNCVFANCDRLVSVNLGDSATSIGNSAFKDCFRLNNVQMGNSVTSIGDNAFEGCVRLPFPQLSNALTYIGENAFKGCNLISGEITIPEEVDTIGNYAFSGCGGITALNMKPLNPPIIYEHTFDSISLNIPVCVPCGRVLNYYVTDYWENFPNILEAEPFIVEVSSNNTAMGTAAITSAPTCSNHEAIIAATANEGFHFHSWNDGNQLNPRIILLNQDTAFTAIFAVNQINVELLSADPSMGTVTGSGIYGYNSLVTATAVPNNNYHFLRWSDGNTQNPRYFTATEDFSLTAIFVSNVSTITVASNNSDMGTVMGGGLYYYQQQISIMANPNYGYHFVAWNDGNTQNPRQLIVNCDTSFVATFAPNIYAVSINSLNHVMGYTAGSGNYVYNSQISFSATANYGYHFTQWNDGSTNNPRTLTVTQDTSFTAQFAANSYAVTVTANDPVMGSAYGAGTFTYNTQTVISAAANYGYHFVQWSDGVTENPRMITVTNSAEYEAQFAINFYTITVGSNNPAIGTASGGGTYNYNSIINLVATPNYGYHFTQWSDGNTDNPRVITVIQNASYTAQFAINSYTVSVSGNDPARGSVSGSGSYIYNNTATISATPNYGYHFTQWNDGNTDNPRTFVVTQDVSYTAQFDYNTYTISTYSNDITIGYVTGGGTYNYNSIVALTAVPSEHYHFVQWSDSVIDNPRNIIVKKDSVYTAYFAIDQHLIQAISGNAAMGSTEGTGTYGYGSSVYISAIPNYGYHFTQWSDGNTQNPRHLTVNGDTVFTAQFDINNYTASVLSGDTTMGSVSGGGTYTYLTELTLTATPVYGYRFVQWSDGSTDNPRTISLTNDTVLTAQFAINIYHVTLSVNDSTLGTTSGSGDYEYLSQVLISATANANCHFVQWSDGSTTNPRQITLTADLELTAQFAENEKFIIQVVSSDNNMGTVTGNGMYYVGTQIVISAVPYEHYRFTQWSDGVTDNPRVVTVLENATYTALFEPVTYEITVLSANEVMGTVTGGGTYAYGSSVELRANANSGYHFVCWNDGDSNSVRTIVVEGNAEYIATFSEGVSVENHQKVEMNIYPNPTSGQLNISADGVQKAEVYDLQGRMVMVSRNENILNLSRLTNGLYTIRVYTTNGISEKKVMMKR